MLINEAWIEDLSLRILTSQDVCCESLKRFLLQTHDFPLKYKIIFSF